MTEILPNAEYMAYLRQGRFMLQRSRATGRHVFYPRIVEPGTGADDLEWVPASGLGTVYSTTTVRQKPPAPSYNVALIDLAEGCRMMSRVEGEVHIGMAVRARVSQQDGEPLIVFDAA